MCHYITLVASTTDAARLDTFMKRYGRKARPVANGSLQKILKPDERQYLTSGTCDCGTVLAFRETKTPEEIEAERAKTIERVRKRRWSKAKIDRWLADRSRQSHRPAHEVDSVEFWTKLLGDLMNDVKLPGVGLFLHYYSGQVETEELEPRRREASAGQDLGAQLERFQEDELLYVRRK